MLRHYFLTAWRNLLRNRLYTLINLLGLGLFGLASFITRQRTKEIGIRKVLGAAQGQLVLLIARDFACLVLIAMGVASLAAWWVMRDWLGGFAYATDMPWYAYFLAGGVALLVATVATSYHSLRVARANPMEALRDE
jgi:putative ABC transport system permease protein